MTFDHPIFLALLALLPVLWIWMRRVPGASTVCLALKCAAYIALVIALADPWSVLLVKKLSVAVLIDTSASMPRESLQRSQAMLRDLVDDGTAYDHGLRAPRHKLRLLGG